MIISLLQRRDRSIPETLVKALVRVMSNPKMPYIIGAQVEHRCLPLKAPYVLSFATLEAFETVLVHLCLDNGETRTGEVVPLPGYASETVEDVLNTTETLLSNCSGQTVQSLRQSVVNQISSTPFASSLILSAIDANIVYSEQSCSQSRVNSQANVQDLLKEGNQKNHLNSRLCIPLVYPTSSAKPNLEQVIEQAMAAGYRTIKVKVGESLEQDLAALPKLRRSLSVGIQVRFDANQGYTYAEARSFLEAVENHLTEQTELVEQPLSPAAWDEMAQLTRQTTIPLMLDESIYTVEDIDRAAEIGCQWIKLKLCKQGGVQELLQLADHAKRIGLKVVIGNGVATDISNFLELQLHHHYAHLFDGASESNGFAKLLHPVLHKTLSVKSGCAVWERQ